MFAEGQRKDGTIYLDTSEEPFTFNVKKYTYGSAQVFDEVTDNTVDTPKYLTGNNATLTKPGFYFVTAGPHCTFSYTTELVIYVVAGKGDGTVPAKPAAAKLSVNGADVTFGAYNINGEHYFKVRDIASGISGTPKQFAVTWDAEKSAINLVRGGAYTPVGGELTVLGDTETQAAIPAAVKVYVDGAESELKAYKIGGSNYFRLSQLSKVFDFAVTYNEETGGQGIRTDLTYWDSY